MILSLFTYIVSCSMMLRRKAVVLWILTLSCLMLSLAARVPQEEVDALQQIITTMGATYWKFNADSCKVEMVGMTPQAPKESEGDVVCADCNFNNTVCHIVKIILKRYSLPGVLPPELVKLPNLREIDLAYNYLSGTIPLEWASTQLTYISVLANRLSGEIPKELGEITSLKYLILEANQFSGTVPSDLGKLVNLDRLILSSNLLTGKLPATFAEIRNLSDFRINDNNFSGPIPDFIQNWKQLKRLEMLASGLEGPIPSDLSLLDKVTELDLSFNRLVGRIPNDISASNLKFVFLTGNMLSGNVPVSILKDGSSIDLSYNNFSWEEPEQPACRPNKNLYINLYRSSSTGDTLRDSLPCMTDVNCPRYGCSLNVNCGGNDLRLKEGKDNVEYDGDAAVEGGGSSRYYVSHNYWGFSSTGDFMDDNNFQNSRFIENTPATDISELYSTARVSPISLTYFRYCMENGDYTITLRFAEIIFTNDSTYTSLGRRIFDIYIQEKLVWKDFSIEHEAGGVRRPVDRQYNASVTNYFLEIRFYWSGKGTTRIPNRGEYGPLISAISVNPTFKSCSNGGKKKVTVYVTVGVVALCAISLVLSILWWKGCLRSRKQKENDFEGMELQTVSFTLKQIKAATNDFDPANKLGEGGFGSVYKGLLSDGTVIAVKQLSSKSRQVNREFLNEIGMISCVQHPNLVKLHGCCIEGDQLLLVYEYMENNSLANALFGSANSQLVLDWPTRFKICVGIARGLAFLHEESIFKIVHRDIKATNVLLDRDLNPKISDFGLARLNEDENSHISTRVAGTIGYMAPEYALWGYLTYKADVYSFGVVMLEIVSGKNNNNYIPSNTCVCLLDWACHMQQSGSIDEIVDQRLGSKVNKEEAERMVKVALLCTNASPSLRPIMSEVVSMLEGRMSISDVIPEPSSYTEDLRFKAMRDFRQEKQTQSFSGTQTQNSVTFQTDVCTSFASTTDKFEINPDPRSY